MTLIRCILVFLLLQVIPPLYADTSTVKVNQNMMLLERYVATSDTTGLYSVLIDINGNFHLYKDERYLHYLINAARKAEEGKIGYTQAFYTLVGLWHKQQNNLELAVDNLVKAYKLIEQEGKKVDGIWVLIELGNIFFAASEPEQAAVFYDKAKSIAEESRNHYALSVIYLNLGLVEHNRGNLAQEIDLLKKSSRERLLSHNPAFVSFTFSKLADAYLELNNTDSAQRYLSEARRIYYAAGKEFGHLHEMPAMLHLGEYKYRMARGEKMLALASLDSARNYLLKTELTSLYLQSYILECKYLVTEKQYAEVISLLNGKMDEMHKGGFADLERQGLHYLARGWWMLGDTKKGRMYYEKLLSFEDSLRKVHSKSKLNHVRSIIELYEKDADLRVAAQQLAYEQEREKMRARERDITLLFTIIGFLLSLTLIVLMNRIQKQKRSVLKLHAELEQQNEQMKDNAIKLERSNVVKDKLFSIIGHDLRGPMNSLLGMVGLMRAEMKSSVKPDFSTHLQMMENTLKETIDLFERLLQWSKLDKKAIHFNPVVIDMEEMVNKVLRFYEPALRHKNIDVAFAPCRNEGYADVNITYTILRNLVANAIHALPAGKNISITTEPASDREMMVCVKDNGYGFAEEVLQRFAAKEGVIASSSNGLGLVLCRELAQMNKGTISIRNGDTGGAEVRFTLPMVERAVQEEIADHKFNVSQD